MLTGTVWADTVWLDVWGPIWAASGAAAAGITSYYTIHSRVAPIEMASTPRKITKAQTGVPIIGATSI